MINKFIFIILGFPEKLLESKGGLTMYYDFSCLQFGITEIFSENN